MIHLPDQICFHPAYEAQINCRVISIYIICKYRKRSKVNTISYLKHIKIVVTHVLSYNTCYTCPVSGCRTHPKDIVVSPLEINIMKIHEKIHNISRMWSSVKNITNYMKSVHR